ncbi:MAG: hypothetical protein J6C79_00260, partial [Clostridia bacterium]|nr:hypothetical protein [Clostridia bacterium]
FFTHFATKIKKYFLFPRFLPWRCGYSRIAQTKRQRTKTFYLYDNSRAFFCSAIFLLFTKLFVCVPLFVDFWSCIPLRHHAALGYAFLPLPLAANKKLGGILNALSISKPL